MEKAMETEATASPSAAATHPAPETTTAATPPPPPPPAAVVAAAAAGRGEGKRKRKRGRPRKYGADGGPVRPLKATPVSASVPEDVGGGQYKHVASVGAVMKRGRGHAMGFVSRVAPVGRDA